MRSVSGVGMRVLSAFFRFMQLVSAVIVTGLVGRYLHQAHDAHAHAGSRLIYAVVLGGISILGSLLLFFPWKGSFFAFPFDIIMFIMWMVLFGLLVGLSRSCGSSWYFSRWDYLLGGWWRAAPAGNNITLGNHCGKWRTLLAFSFIASIFWLLSACLGLFKSLRRDDSDDTYSRFRHNEKETHTTQPAPSSAPGVNAPVAANRGNEATYGGPAYGTESTVRDTGNVAQGSNTAGYGAHGDNIESAASAARGAAARDPGYSV